MINLDKPFCFNIQDDHDVGHCLLFTYFIILHSLLSSAVICFSKKKTFSKKYFRNTISRSECQTVWILNTPEISLGLIRVQTVCKGYQQTRLVDNELNDSI